MKICVIVPSTDYLAQAGVRIRYRRIEPHLAALGHTLAIAVIDSFRKPEHLSCDAYLFSKCYDARAILLSKVMQAAGKLVAIDLFDDIFSQAEDSRFVRHRAWLREMVGSLDFALCSTRRMREIFAGYAPNLPVHVLNDPFETFDMVRLARRIAEKREEAVASRRIKLAWFGVGDNPYFTVGLSDLSMFGDRIRSLATRGFSVDLTILTNERALTADGLRMIARLGVPHRVSEWTREREIDLLDESLISFLPVNGQGFSNAKSLNRAVTALTGGTQVLSAGYPLYASLAAFLYRDPAMLLQDIENGDLRMRRETLSGLAEAFAKFGDPDREVAKLSDFLGGLKVGMPLEPVSLALLNGRKSPVAVHRLAHRLNQLSVATPYSPIGLDCDVRLKPVVGSHLLDVRLSARAIRRLSAEDAKSLIIDKAAGVSTIRIAASVALVDRLAIPPANSLAGVSTAYVAVVNDVAAVVNRLFPGTLSILNEAKAPLSADLRISANDTSRDVVTVADEQAELGREKYEDYNPPERLAAIRGLLASTDMVSASNTHVPGLLEGENGARAIVSGQTSHALGARRLPNPGPVRKLGYMERGSHSGDLETVVPAIVDILDRHPDIEFEIFGGISIPAAFDRFGGRVRNIPPIPDYVAFLSHLAAMDWDIGLCPSAPASSGAVKTNIKWMEYTAAGIAVVATRGAVYDECCGGGAGMLAGNHAEWSESLDRLIREDDLRLQQTRVAQQKLLTELSPEALQRETIDMIGSVPGRSLSSPSAALAAK